MIKYLVLENIRSAYNVGAIFRTADGAGVDKIFLVGYTPTPVDRFGRTQAEINKTSLGASETVPWEYSDEIESVIEKIKDEKFNLVPVEITDQSISLPKYTVPERVAYVLGNEVEGVSEAALKAADTIVEIPMRGRKESLNVSVAAGIVMYHGIVAK